jgi:hypothetical protein
MSVQGKKMLEAVVRLMDLPDLTPAISDGAMHYRLSPREIAEIVLKPREFPLSTPRFVAYVAGIWAEPNVKDPILYVLHADSINNKGFLNPVERTAYEDIEEYRRLRRL